MAHSTTYDYIYDPGGTENGLSIYEIMRCLGASTQDLGSLCEHINIRAMAKCKPEYRNTLLPLTDLGNNAVNDRQSVSPYSIWRKTITTYDAQMYFSKNSALNGFCTYELSYRKPTGSINVSPYRLLDFDGYYNGAPDFCITCAVSNTVAYNSMDTNYAGDVISFYAFFKGITNTNVNNRAFSSSEGIDRDTACVSSNDLAHCLSADELISGLIPSSSANATFSFGVVLFSGSTYFGFYPCYYPIADYGSTYYTEMWRLPVYSSSTRTSGGKTYYNGIINPNRHVAAGSISQPEVGVDAEETQNPGSGTYTAIPVIYNSSTDVFYPMFKPTINNVKYGNYFTFKVGGQDMYRFSVEGASETAVGTTTRNITTNKSSLYVTVTIRNYSYTRETYMSGNLDKFQLKTLVNGTVVSQEAGEERPTEKNIEDIERTSLLYSPQTTGNVTIPLSTSSFATLQFAVGEFWTNQTGIITPATIDSGNVLLSCSLYFDGVLIGDGAWQPTISVTYDSNA